MCDIDFTSRHPYAMHFQGAKHAKKLKMQESLQTIQSQGNCGALSVSNLEFNMYLSFIFVNTKSMLNKTINTMLKI